jgi:hypothetical protein
MRGLQGNRLKVRQLDTVFPRSAKLPGTGVTVPDMTGLIALFSAYLTDSSHKTVAPERNVEYTTSSYNLRCEHCPQCRETVSGSGSINGLSEEFFKLKCIISY